MYIGILIFVISNVLIALSSGNMLVLLLGLFLSSIPGAWCFPFIFSNLDRITTKNTVNFATSLIFIGCNIGNFTAPIAMKIAQTITGSQELTAPFYVFGSISFIVLLVTIMVTRKTSKKEPT